MIRAARRLRGAGVSAVVTVVEDWKPYRRFRDPDWNPAASAPPKEERREAPRLPPAAARARAARRRAEFARLRTEEGLTTAQAGEAVGISDSHARKYERDRVKALAEKAVAKAESAP